MPKSAKDGALLEDLAAMSISDCRKAEAVGQRQGQGRKPVTLNWVLAVMIMLGVMLTKKTESFQFA